MTTDYFNLENRRSELIERILNTSSFTLRVFLFYKYFSVVLSYNDNNAEWAFLQEFIEDYLTALSKFEVRGTDPEFTTKLLLHLKELKTRNIASAFSEKLDNIILQIEEKQKRLLSVLEGNNQELNGKSNAYFPLIDRDNEEGFYGIIESVIVHINKSSEKDNFIVVPSDKNSDEKIIEQCRKSWHLAVKELKRYVRKPFKFYEVIVSFEKKEGFYEGDSLGTALALSFLEELMNFYNPVYSMEISDKTAFTGAVSEKGITSATGNRIIIQKIKAVFYSEIRTFVIPKAEESTAEEALTELNKKYPSRELKLVYAEDINDILNRRDLVKIKRRSVLRRAGRLIKQNPVLIAINVLLLAAISFFLIKDIDTNPYTFTADGTKLYIKNRSGRVLWEKNLSIPESRIYLPGYMRRMVKIVDVNLDGENEVIITGEDNEGTILKCYDAEGKHIWNYSFGDKVYSERERLNTEYNLNIIDTCSFYGERSLFLYANNLSSFSSAIIRIGIETGKRLPGTFWSSGLGADALIKDIDGDMNNDIVGIGYDNGYEDVVFFVFKPDTMTRVRPTIPEYLIQGYPVAAMKAYIRFPKSDYDIYYKVRTPSLGNTYLMDETVYRKYKFGVSIPQDVDINELGYDVSYDFRNIDVIIDSNFRVRRDTLVARGILKPPYTDTEEYKDIIKNNILYWKHDSWVTRQDLD